MQRFRTLPLLPILVSLVAGLLLGRFILGWWLPVNLTDAGPRNLAQTDRLDHLDNYVRGLLPYVASGNTAEIGRALCYPTNDFEVVSLRAASIQDLITAEPAQQGLIGETLNQYNTVLNSLANSGGCEAIHDEIVGSIDRTGFIAGLPWTTCLFGLLILAALLGGLWFLSDQQGSRPQRNTSTASNRGQTPSKWNDRQSRSQQSSLEESSMDSSSSSSSLFDGSRYAPPLDDASDEYVEEVETFSNADAGFVATYTRGNDSFERVFEIYGTDNNYLGDCSVQIADTVGNDRQKISAFEIRLFEVGNPRSVTKLVMSEHAYNDGTLRSRLAAQGTPVLAERRQPIMLEGSLITIETDITELIYASVETEPENSIFERFSVKLKAFVNQPDDSDESGYASSDWLDS